MSAIAEVETVPDVIEATVNYVAEQRREAVHLYRRARARTTSARAAATIRAP